VLSEKLVHQLDAASRRHIWQAHKPAMAGSTKENEPPKVFVHRDQNAPFSGCPCQKGPVPGIGATLSGFDNIVLLGAQPLSQSTPGASVHQETHQAPTRTASNASWAITA